MLNSEYILNQIRDDAPAVYDILHEQCIPYPVGGYPHSDSQYTWEDYFKYNIELKPTPDRLLEALTEYSGDNWDVHYWSGRYAQMIEHEKMLVADTGKMIHQAIENFLIMGEVIPTDKVISLAKKYFSTSSNLNKFINSL